jgi:Family of unknown function (DUF6348)
MNDAVTYEAFREVLNSLRPGWVTMGDAIVGPDGATVRLTQRHESLSEGHVDVQFVLDDNAPRKVELWDCVVGYGTTPADRARFAAYLWGQTTAGTLLELKYSRRGEFADHYHATDEGAFSGWNAIAGAIVGFGRGESASTLQRWWLDNQVLPVLARALDDSLSELDAPYGLKILFGGDGIAEVRVNGEQHDAASSVLAGLPWPRLSPPGFVRSYVLVLHREDPDEI